MRWSEFRVVGNSLRNCFCIFGDNSTSITLLSYKNPMTIPYLHRPHDSGPYKYNTPLLQEPHDTPLFA